LEGLLFITGVSA